MSTDLLTMAETTSLISSPDMLVELSARATALYAIKKYEEAAEIYSQATEMQSELNGEMDPKNADLLFFYGRCLFYLAQKTSTVLGDTAASAQLKTSNGEKKGKKRKADGRIIENGGSSTSSGKPLEPVLENDSEHQSEIPANTANSNSPSKTLFQITGDENFADSSDEEEDKTEGEDDREEDEEDDFNTAFEILDLARLLYLKQLEEVPEAEQTRSRELQTRLADIYDLQAEISLEGERFDAAAADFRSCLDLKLKLYPPESSLLAECHFKLSVVLEAASQVQQRDTSGNPMGKIEIDWKLRNEAVEQMEKAIESCRLRLNKEKAELKSTPEQKPEEKKRMEAEVDDVQDMLEAMEQRLDELKQPPVSVEEEAKKEAQRAMMGSILGSVLGGSIEEQQAKMAEIVAGANDLTGMVKKKKTKTSGSTSPATSSSNAANGKRKAIETEAQSLESKRARFEDEPGEI